MELDWAREKKVLDADPTMVIFVISIKRNRVVYIPNFDQFCIHQTLKIQVKLYLKRMEREGIARVGIFVHNHKKYMISSTVLAAIHWTFLLMF